MKKKVFGRHFKRDANERKALFKGLLTSLVMEERIQTTEQKAKAIRSRAEKLVTRAKKGGSNVADQMREYLRADAIEKMLTDIAPRFKNRQGGYTRILRTTRRVADNAQLALMEWTEQKAAVVKETKEKETKQKETVAKEVTAAVESEASSKGEKKSRTTKSSSAKQKRTTKKEKTK